MQVYSGSVTFWFCVQRACVQRRKRLRVWHQHSGTEKKQEQHDRSQVTSVRLYYIIASEEEKNSSSAHSEVEYHTEAAGGELFPWLWDIMHSNVKGMEPGKIHIWERLENLKQNKEPSIRGYVTGVRLCTKTWCFGNIFEMLITPHMEASSRIHRMVG